MTLSKTLVSSVLCTLMLPVISIESSKLLVPARARPSLRTQFNETRDPISPTTCHMVTVLAIAVPALVSSAWVIDSHCRGFQDTQLECVAATGVGGVSAAAVGASLGYVLSKLRK